MLKYKKATKDQGLGKDGLKYKVKQRHLIRLFSRGEKG